MSYELVFSHRTKCPCGKGDVVEEIYSNDWNQFRTKCYIDCANCKNVYRLSFDTHRDRKGECYTVPYLVNTETEEKIKITFDKQGGSHVN